MYDPYIKQNEVPWALIQMLIFIKAHILTKAAWDKQLDYLMNYLLVHKSTYQFLGISGKIRLSDSML